jgi:zinc/manganese transport system permease protein
MDLLWSLFAAPFAEYGFMRRALVACLALAMGCGPIGVFLILRRMSLVGDAMSHAVLPGAAIAFLLFGFSLPAMTIGGFVVGLAVALLAGSVTRLTPQREDTSFAALFLVSLALGVMLVSAAGTSVDLMHVLFGAILAVDDPALMLVAGIASTSLLLLAAIYRGLVIECVDPGFLRAVRGGGARYHFLFLLLVVLNRVAGFQSLGTLMAVGLMMLPAASARFWTQEIGRMVLFSTVVAFACGYAGLLLSYHLSLPSGPAVILTAGLVYALSVLLGPHGGLLPARLRSRHYQR